MVTIAIFSLIAGLIACGILTLITEGYFETNFIMIIVIIPTSILTIAIVYDLSYDVGGFFDSFFLGMLIMGLLVLGFSTFYILLFAIFKGISFARFNFPGNNFFGFVGAVIGFISSILGIISFYLEIIR